MRTTLPMITEGFRDLDRFFDDFLGRDGFWPQGRGRRHMNYDLVQKADRYELNIDLPGVKPDDVTIEVDGSTLKIEGERKTEDRKETDTVLVSNRYVGKISHAFTLNDDIDPDRIEAEFENGTLKVSLAKRAATESRRIPIGGKTVESRKLKTA